MPATPITESVRYYRRGVSRVLWVPTIANRQSPTRVELDAGTALELEVGEVDGWQVTSETVEAPALGTRFNAKVAGPISADDSSLTMYASQDGEDVRTLLPRSTSGFIVWMDEGDVPTQTMDVFPVTVMQQSKPRGLDALGMIQVQFAITREPAENVTIPAAT